MSSFGTTVSGFADFLNLTRDNKLRQAKDILNDASTKTFAMGDLLVGQDHKEIVRGGKFISERIKLVQGGNFAGYQPGQQRNPTRTSRVQTMNLAWRFYENNIPYTEAEIELNEGDEFASYSNLKRSLMQDLESDHYEGLEALLYARPNAADMETGSLASSTTAVPGAAYSIPCFITEDGGVPIGVDTWTTIHGLNPSTYENWKNQYATYTHGDKGNAETGVFAAFDNVLAKMEVQPPPGAKHFEKATKVSDVVCHTNTDGLNVFQSLLRSANDQTRAGPQDPSYGMPQFKGITIRRVAQLDSALLEQSGGSLTGAAYTAGKPRYFLINKRYLFPVFHGKHFMDDRPPKDGGASQPDTTVLFRVSWLNMVCRSRRRQGIVRPA